MTPEEELTEFLGALGAAADAGFDEALPLHVARAPGRLDVMGGMADYSGSNVLQLPIRPGCWCATQVRPSGAGGATFRAVTIGQGGVRPFACPLGDVVTADRGAARAALLAHCEAWRAASEAEGLGAPGGGLTPLWGAYLGGALHEVAAEGARAAPGAWAAGPVARGGHDVCLAVWSRVPVGKGVASSAAVEAAAAFSLAACLGVDATPFRKALLSYFVETRVVGVPCGVMDQMAVSLGRADHLLSLLCQPREEGSEECAQVNGWVPVPRALAFVGIDTGVHHSVGGGEFLAARVGAFMGLAILNAEGRGGRASCLANVHGDEDFSALFPDTLTGRQFRERYGELPDPVTRGSVRDDGVYPVRSAALHGILEPRRVDEFRRALERIQAGGGGGEPDGADLARLSGILRESHLSYNACGLGWPEADAVSRLVRERAAAAGHACLLGCRISGGGCGGTLVVMARAGAPGELDAAVAWLLGEYERETGRAGAAVLGSSDGAASFGAAVAVCDAGRGWRRA